MPYRTPSEPSIMNGAMTVDGPSAPSSRGHDSITDYLKLEHQIVKVPFESLKKTLKASSRLAEKELQAFVTSISDAAKSDMASELDEDKIDSLVSKLQGLKRKLDESNKVEQLQIQKCRTRLDHLSLVSSGPKGQWDPWNRLHVNRILVDHLLRKSYTESASKLIDALNLKDLVDSDIFTEVERVEGALDRGDCSEALAWCSDNRTRLRKSKGVLEFHLRLQEFIELVRAEKMLDAITYARKHLSQWAPVYMKELQQAMATLAFKSTTSCATYKVLFDPKQWDSLKLLFRQELYRMYGMTQESLLHIYLQAGLSALKTPFGLEEGCTKEDPLSQAAFRKLAEPLPFSKHIHSKLVCGISKEIMDDHNPPMVLPNGNAYSRKALEDMAFLNQGLVTCPRTGDVFPHEELVKAYIF